MIEDIIIKVQRDDAGGLWIGQYDVVTNEWCGVVRNIGPTGNSLTE